MKRTIYLVVTVFGLSCGGAVAHDLKLAADPNVAFASLSAAGKCDKSVSAFIPETAVGGARLLGGTQVRARTILDPVHFSTECEVLLDWHSEAAHPECGEVDMLGARMAISYNAVANEFTLHFADSPSNASPVPGMQSGRGGQPTSGPSDYLVGTLPGKGGQPERKYFVYFKNTLVSSDERAGPLKKVYRIQVYEKGSEGYACPTHMPDHSAQDDPGSESVMKEAGNGGGIEPRR